MSKPDSLSNLNSFIQLQFQWERYFTLKNKLTIIPSVQSGISLNSPSYLQKFYLGGLTFPYRKNSFSFAGSFDYEIQTNNFIIAGMNIRYELIPNFYAGIIMQSAVTNNQFELKESLLKTSDYQLGIGIKFDYNSKFGPMNVGFSTDEKFNPFVWQLNLGFPY